MSPRTRHLIYGSVTIAMALVGIATAAFLAFHGAASVMRNPLLDQAVDTLNAAMAWGAKRHELRQHELGVEIIRRGKPAALITHEAAREWANGIKEARHG